MDPTQSGSVTTRIQDHTAFITFSHPAHNSLPGRLLDLLCQAIAAAGEEPEVRLLVLQSEGDRTFCAGASFDELAAIQDLATGKKFFSGFANVINAMRMCPKLILARVQGKAIGGGVGLASAADYCLATRHSTIKLSELAVGIGPFVIGPAVQRKIGMSAFSELSMNATEWRTPEWARQKGLFNEVFDTIEQLDAYILHFSNILVQSHPEAMSELKRIFWEGTDGWDQLLSDRAAISGRLVLSDYTKKAIAAFKAVK